MDAHSADRWTQCDSGSLLPQLNSTEVFVPIYHTPVALCRTHVSTCYHVKAKVTIVAILQFRGVLTDCRYVTQ
jgi:hypothetical protein